MRQIAVFFWCCASKHKCLGGRIIPKNEWAGWRIIDRLLDGSNNP